MATKTVTYARHGMAKTAEYRAWLAMRTRCSSTKPEYFQHYGARGISVCERWQKSFIDFYTDMGSKPHPSMSIDRINNDGNYEPDNCRWATSVEQNRNRRVYRNARKSQGAA